MIDARAIHREHCSRDACAIAQAVDAALEDDVAIDDATARTIAALWHSGQGSAGYAFASSGAISSPRDVHSSLFGQPPTDVLERLASDALAAYLVREGVRGPVAGWADLWARHDDCGYSSSEDVCMT